MTAHPLSTGIANVGLPSDAADDEGSSSAALGELWLAEWDGLVRMTWLMVGDRALAEDIVSGTFARLMPSLLSKASPGAYWRAAVVNACRSHFRREALRSRHAAFQPPEAAQIHAPVEFVALVEALPARQRAVLVLRYLYDMADDDIAAALGCRRATVRSLSRHALRRLREMNSDG